MNERNYDALEYLLAEAGCYGPEKPTVEGLCQFLVSRGVLVPSALTDEQARLVGHDTAWLHMDQSAERSMTYEDATREMLERIAKGQTE